MSIGIKIRILLLIMGVCCILTALSLKNSVSRADLLQYEGEKLQQNLSTREQLILNLLSKPQEVQKIKKLHTNEGLALDFISAYMPQGIDVITYQNNELKFWSSNILSPPPFALIKEGTSLMQLSNGWYEVIKKTEDKFTLIFFINIKNQFAIENKYLNNDISPNLSSSNALDLASFTDVDVFGVKSVSGKLLFEVKLKPGYSKTLYDNIEAWLWIIGLFSFILFFNSFCSWLAKKGKVTSATILLILFFIILRVSDLHFRWFNYQFDINIFSSTIYGESFFLPSLGDLFFNVICFTWICLFAYGLKDKYRLPAWLTTSKFAGFVVHLLLILVASGYAFFMDKLFSGMVYNSKINFDITNIINLSWVSWISIVILCLVWFNLYLLCRIALQMTLLLKVTAKERVILFLILFGCYFIYRLNVDFTVFFIVYAVFLCLVAFNVYIQNGKFSVRVYAAIFFSLALISAIKHIKYQDVKERNKQLNIALELQSSDNPRILSSIEHLEKQVSDDPFVLNYFENPTAINTVDLEKLINRKYLDSYLAQYEYHLFTFSTNDKSFDSSEPVSLVNYKNFVQSGSVKVSNFFYRLNDTFGYQSYFGIIPIFNGNRMLGTVVLELKSQQYNYNNQFPELLVDGKVKMEDDYKSYSFAFYNHGELINQAGKFTYRLNDSYFEGKLDTPVYFRDEKLNYKHMVYKPGQFKTIVISRENVSYVTRLAILSFFFLVFILFSVALYVIIWLVKSIDESWGDWFNINRSLMINANKILYKTRIQFSIVLSVVATLLIVGWTTFFYISSEYRKQQDDVIREKLRKVQLLYGEKVSMTGVPEVTDASIKEFNQFSDVNSTFLNFYDAKGKLLYTSIPKLYDYGILARVMAPKAHIYLSHFQRSEYYTSNETIGHFTYSAAYAAIRNAQNQTIGYIGLPYFGNEYDYQSKIGIFINTLINIYALVFVAIGILAVFLANQITSPLTFIQDSIRKTKLGQKNQPILWSRHDEIGSLIKEYNKMIAALELSAVKLAKSERESAWREMAKQVAHEIKNPLTPLKLGVQLLEKSWKEKDPNFEKKFERFNKSFVEQIDSLATIASEFSNFAKMPDTKLQRVALMPVIRQASDVFINNEKLEMLVVDQTTLMVHIMGDKDQLLRSFNNLLKNAVEASAGIKDSLIYIKVRNDHKKVWIEISDNGKGIDYYLQEKIFAPNFTTKSSGTGLGLAFVKQAVENAGGTIEFKSVIDTGTTFYLSFPLA